MGCEVVVHDPYVLEYQGDVAERVTGADCAVIMVAHSAYQELEPAALARVMRHPGLVSGRHVVSIEAARDAGLCTIELGVGTHGQAAPVD
jgi:UDP-N-acetyl-D-mannosaminuronate dehydrogenase